jgi:rubredoxin
VCGYIYDEDQGDAHEGFPPGTGWERVPVNWSCPDCAVRDKGDFEKLGDVAQEPLPQEDSA